MKRALRASFMRKALSIIALFFLLGVLFEYAAKDVVADVCRLITSEILESDELLLSNDEYKVLLVEFVKRDAIDSETDRYVLDVLCSMELDIPADG